MLLQSENGVSVEVKIIGYQFPGHGPDPGNPKHHYDANWLVIETKFRENNLDLTFTAPCMLTYDAEQIYFWLLAIEQGKAKQLIGGQEPEITFELLKRDDEKCWIQFKYMNWVNSERRWDRYYILLELTYEALKQAAAEWYSEIQRFPVRFTKSMLLDDSE